VRRELRLLSQRRLDHDRIHLAYQVG
jgi:hypothetical protein